MAMTTRTQVTKENTEFYDRTMLRRAVASFVHTRWAQVRDIPANSGTNLIKFRRYGNLTAATTALTEGVTPVGSQLSITDVTATVLQYGDYVTITDILDFQGKDPMLTETAEILGDQAGDTLDQLTRDVLAAGTVVQYADGVADRTLVSTTGLLGLVEVQKAVRTLKNAKAKKLTRMIDSSTGVGSLPLNNCFVGLCHPNTAYDLKNVTQWVGVEKYASTKAIMPDEIGSLDEVRFVESTNCKVFTAGGVSSLDVYATLIFGSDAYGISRISGESLKNIVKPLGSAGSSDPLDQRATSGWKATFVAKILNDAFMVRIEHAVTA